MSGHSGSEDSKGMQLILLKDLIALQKHERAVVAAAKSAVVENPMLMKRITSHIPAEELIRLRETCHSWNEHFTSEIRDGLNRPPIEIKVDDCNNQLKEVTYTMNSSKQIPSTKFAIFHLTSAQSHDFKSFTSIFGPTITKLQLNSGDSGTTKTTNVYENLRALRELVFERVPNLEELILETDKSFLNNNNGQAQRIVKQLPKLKTFGFQTIGGLYPGSYVFLVDVLENAVGLETFSFKAICAEGNPTLSNRHVVSAMQNSMKNLNKLKALQIYNLKSPEIHKLVELARRNENNLQLQEFCTSILYKIWENEEVFDNFYTFLSTQRPTLQKLKIEVDGCVLEQEQMTNIRLPTLSKLYHFELARIGNTRLDVRYQDEILATTFPSLESFTYKTCDLLPSQVLCGCFADDMERFAHEGVAKLCLVGYIDHDILEAFAVRMHSITQLEITLTSPTLNAETMRAIWTCWPALTHLRISLQNHSVCTPEIDLDELLSGISAFNLNTLRRLFVSKSQCSLEEIQSLSVKYKTRPGLMNLKHLQKLVLESSTHASSYRITDVGGYFGLAICSQLQHVKIQNGNGQYSGLEQIYVSTECRKVIRKALGPHAVLDF